MSNFRFTLLVISIFFLLFSENYAQMRKGSVKKDAKTGFANQGDFELGGSITYGNSSADNVSLSQISIIPTFAYFVADGLALGISPLNLTYISLGNNNYTVMNVNVIAAYNFNTNGTIYPYIEPQIGYGIYDRASYNIVNRVSGINYGGRLGMKVLIDKNALLNIGLNYNTSSFNTVSNTNISFAVGFNVCFH